MSVPKNKRTLSDYQFYQNALKLREEITLFLLKDFGIKSKVRNLEFLVKSYNLTYGDISTLEEIYNKYGMNGNILDSYPQWFVNSRRKKILDILDNIMQDINIANSIYPQTLEEYSQRRTLQDKAIGECYYLTNELTYISKIFDTDKNKYMRWVDNINQEIRLLKGWRKKDNRFKKEIEK